MPALRVLVTGASSGIGAAVARRFAAQGAQVVLAARRADRLEQLATTLRGLGGDGLPIVCDVTRDGDPERAVALAVERWGGLDVAVANAGFGVTGRFAELTLDDYRRQFETNVVGVLRTAHAALPELLRSRGRLAVTGSVMGHVPMAGASPYVMSKFAVRGFCASIHDELRRQGVSVTHIAPGFVASEIRRVGNDGVLHAERAEPVPAWMVADADRCARTIVRAIMRRRREQVVTGHGRVCVWLYRHLPWLVDAILWRAGVERARR